MKTIIKISENKGILFILLLIFISVQSKADTTSTASVGTSKDGFVSFYIIGGVFGLGLVIYLINKITSKFIKEENKKSIPTISHRRTHHHRVIKKSA